MADGAWHDMVVRGGRVMDGTGRESFAADVAIDGDAITAVGEGLGRGREEIDAQGLLVTPGFIDIHTHYDGQATWSRELTPSSLHGVTTVVTGNCGVGFAPCRAGDREALIRMMEGVEDIPEVVMADALDWQWESFPEFLDRLDAQNHDINLAVLMPHSPLRVYVMGERGFDREQATADDLARMRALVREGMEAGAIGFSTSRISGHRTSAGEKIPSFGVVGEELTALALGLADAGHGIFEMASESAPEAHMLAEMDIAIEVARRSGRPISMPLGQITAHPDLWRRKLDIIARANAQGLAMHAQVLPRATGVIMGLELTIHPFALCASYEEIAHLPLAERVAKMREPERRARIMSETPRSAALPIMERGRAFDYVFPLGSPPDYEPGPEDSLEARARRLGVDPLHLAYDMLLEREGHSCLYVPGSNYADRNLDAVREMIEHPHVIPGLGDGGAHYGSICDASWPSFMLSHWVRERGAGRIALPAAIAKMTSAPARAFGLLDRGVIAPGYRADLNILDADRVRPHAPEVHYDLPTGARRLMQGADGFACTIVNGVVSHRDGASTGRFAGRLVRGPQPAPLHGTA